MQVGVACGAKGDEIFFAIVPAILYVVVMFFLPIGGLVGKQLALLDPLRGYGWNLAGSLAGILAFTALSFSAAPPAVWILLGLAVAVPFFSRERWALAVLAVLVCVLALPQVRNLRDHNYDSGGHPYRLGSEKENHRGDPFPAQRFRRV